MNEYEMDDPANPYGVTRRVDQGAVTRAPGVQAWGSESGSPNQQTVVVSRSGPGHAMAWLVAATGPARGRHFRLDPAGTIIGRDPDVCGVVFDDPTVSRQHAKVRSETADGRVRYHILDMGSRGGTQVNGVRIDRMRLEDGARVAIGQTELVFKQSAR